MSESVRQRVRDILEPFMAQFEFEIEPGASDSEIADVCDRLRLERLPSAVDEFLRLCGAPGGPAREVFRGEDPLSVDAILDHGWHSLKVARMWGASPVMVAGAVPYPAGDSATAWLRAPDSGSPLDPGDLEIWWALESNDVGRHDVGFLEDLEMRVRSSVGNRRGQPKQWPEPRHQPDADFDQAQLEDVIDRIPDEHVRAVVTQNLDTVRASVARAVEEQERADREEIRDALSSLLESLGRPAHGASRRAIDALCQALSVESLRADVDEFLLLVGNDDELGRLLFPHGPLMPKEIIRHRSRIDAMASQVGALRLPRQIPLPGVGLGGGWIDLHGAVWELTEDDYEYGGTFGEVVRSRAADALRRLRGTPPAE